MKVLLVEAGPRDWNPMIHMPTGEIFTIGSSVDWQFKSEPEKALGGYQVPLPRGRVLGGSYLDQRPDLCSWSSSRLRRVASARQCWLGLGERIALFSRGRNPGPGAKDEMRGTAGPLQTAFGRYKNPLFDAFLAAGQQAGFRSMPTITAPNRKGLSGPNIPIPTSRPMRCSAARAYVWPALKRKNLTLWTGARLLKLVLDGKTCTGAIIDHNGRQRGRCGTRGPSIRRRLSFAAAC